MNSGFYIFITVVRAPSGLVTTSTTQPASLREEQEGGLEVLAGTEAAGEGSSLWRTVEQAGVQTTTPSSIHLIQQTLTGALPWAKPREGRWHGEVSEKQSLPLDLLMVEAHL